MALPCHVCQGSSCRHRLWRREAVQSRHRLRCRGFSRGLFGRYVEKTYLLPSLSHQGNTRTFLHLQRKKKTTTEQEGLLQSQRFCDKESIVLTPASAVPVVAVSQLSFSPFLPRETEMLGLNEWDSKHGLWTSMKPYQVTWKLTFQFLSHSGVVVLSDLFSQTLLETPFLSTLQDHCTT